MRTDMARTTAEDLLTLLASPGSSDAEIRSAFGSAVLYPEELSDATQAVDDASTLSNGARTVRLFGPEKDDPPVRYLTADRLVYVLKGQVLYTAYEVGASGLTSTDAHVVGVGQVKDIPKGTAHRLHLHGDDEAILLEVVMGTSSVETLPEPQAAEEASDYYYEYEDCYRTVYEEGADLWEMAEPNEALVSILREAGKEFGQRWLDLGCGEGRDSLYLAKQGFDVTGVDVSRIALDKARSRARAEDVHPAFLERDVTRLEGLPSQSFDVAINMGCLHMLSDPRHREMHLARVFELVRSGGHFIVAHCRSEWLKGFYSVPDYERVGAAVTGKVLPRRIRLANGEERWIELPTTHFLEAGEEELTEELGAAGFEVVQTLSQNNEAFGNTAVLVSRKP
jgi:ubiquinone/menaquinone biosynthesis C-methylase UbiE